MGHSLINSRALERTDRAGTLGHTLPPGQLGSRESRQPDTIIPLNGLWIGGGSIAVMAGPCAVEDRGQMREVAHAVKEAGVKILRGGAFKPRTSPYSFQGLGCQGLEILAEVGAEFGLAVVTEVIAPEDVSLVAGYADILQVGSRNMQNFALLYALGDCNRPVLLKRGMMSTMRSIPIPNRPCPTARSRSRRRGFPGSWPSCGCWAEPWAARCSRPGGHSYSRDLTTAPLCAILSAGFAQSRLM
jgi:hypothetical protein